MSEAPLPTFHVRHNGQQTGPFTVPQARGAVASGHLLPDDPACPVGDTAWQPLSTLLSPPPPGSANAPAHSAWRRMILPVGRSGWAIAAGYLGLFGLLILPALLALVVSLIAINDIEKHRNTPHPKHGMGRAIFGFCIGFFGTGVIVAFLIVRNLLS